MNCTEVLKGLGALLDGALPEPEAGALRAHLRACPACAREEALFRRVRTVLGGMPVLPAPAGLAGRVMARVRGSEAALQTWVTLLPTIRRLAAAAAVVFALSGTYALFTPAPPREGEGASVVAGLKVRPLERAREPWVPQGLRRP